MENIDISELIMNLLTIDNIFALVVLVVLLGYWFFAFALVWRVRVLAHTLFTRLSPAIQLLAIVHLLFVTIGVLAVGSLLLS